MILFIVRPYKESDLEQLIKVYKEVFSGFPWYEDLACKNCKALYTNREIKTESKDRVTKLEDQIKCVKCKLPLELVSYYPDMIDQTKLIAEATNISGFIGYLALIENNPIGFTWGYKFPKNRTTSVNFPEINKLLIENLIDPDTSFYGAETGVIEEYQDKGIGKSLIILRTKSAFDRGYKTFLNRTINIKMRGVLTKIFSNIEPRKLFEDPETSSPWYCYRFENFNLNSSKEKYDKY